MYRLSISGHNSAISVVVDRLVSSHDFSVVRIPSIGDCLAASVNPRLWMSATCSFVAQHPGNLVFLGGAQGDRRRLSEVGVIALHVTDKLTLEVCSDPFAENAPRWVDRSARTLDQRIFSALKIAEMMKNSPAAAGVLSTGTR